jgi:hypothetical protein
MRSDEKQRFSLKINFEHDEVNDDCGRKLWLMSKISPSPKIKFIKAGAIAGALILPNRPIASSVYLPFP